MESNPGVLVALYKHPYALALAVVLQGIGILVVEYPVVLPFQSSQLVEDIQTNPHIVKPHHLS